MFEDSTFESGGKIKSKSGRWMMVTFITNGAILVAMILYPADLPRSVAQGDDADLAGCPATATTTATTAATG